MTARAGDKTVTKRTTDLEESAQETPGWVARQADALLTFDVIDSWSHRWLGGCVY